MSAGLYSIGEAAEAFQVPVSTLRYYDDIGLVSASVRRSGCATTTGPPWRVWRMSCCGGSTEC
jgi:hypothetical protein